MTDSKIDGVMRQVREEVEKKRRAGVYPADLNETLEIPQTGGPGSTPELESKAAHTLEQMKARAILYGDMRIESDRRFLGPLVVLAKRVVKKSIGWYTTYIIDQINLFHISTVRTSDSLTNEVRETREMAADVMVGDFAKRISAIESDMLRLKAAGAAGEILPEDVSRFFGDSRDIIDARVIAVDSLPAGSTVVFIGGRLSGLTENEVAGLSKQIMEKLAASGVLVAEALEPESLKAGLTKAGFSGVSFDFVGPNQCIAIAVKN